MSVGDPFMRPFSAERTHGCDRVPPTTGVATAGRCEPEGEETYLAGVIGKMRVLLTRARDEEHALAALIERMHGPRPQEATMRGETAPMLTGHIDQLNDILADFNDTMSRITEKRDMLLSLI